MSTLLHYQHFYLVGIKGVAMTALAQCLLDAGKSVRGSDLPEQFVTQQILEQRQLQIDESFAVELPTDTECVIYTSAHQAQQNPQVQAALNRGLPTMTHAEALSQLFNDKDGIAVCGVGGKSTSSAMITWILEQIGKQPSYAIGVGNIPGLEKTGVWRADSQFFVAEADEYVTDPSALSQGVEITPRFSFLKPSVTVCTNLKHDHPDVYPTFTETKRHFQRFFDQIKPEGTLIANLADRPTIDTLQFWQLPEHRQVLWFGNTTVETAKQLGPNKNQFVLVQSTFTALDGQTSCMLICGPTQEYLRLTLQLPGMYNLQNAAAAVAACWSIGIPVSQSVQALAHFRSTQRRSEFVGEKSGIHFYDDYAHHPHEVSNVIHAYRQWFPNRRLVVGFQSHTFSRTKQFFSEFVDAFAEVDMVLMIDIFPSAREAFDSTVSSDQLCAAIHQKYPQITALNCKTVPELAHYCQTHLVAGDIFLTIGAGDIYQVHQLMKEK